MAKKLKQNKEEKDPLLEDEYYEEIEFICPKRGKIKQRVKVKKYKTVKHLEKTNYILMKSSLIDNNDNQNIIHTSNEEESEE